MRNRAVLLLALFLSGAAGCASRAPGPAADAERECAHCGRALRGDRPSELVELQGRRFHAACYEVAGPRCRLCGSVLHGRYATLGDDLDYHPSCYDAAPRCDGCGLPGGKKTGPAWRWSDGRVSCASCHAEAVTDARGADEACAAARRALRDALGLDLGAVDTPVVLVARDDLLARAGDLAHPSLKGLTEAIEQPPAPDGRRGARRYRIFALAGSPREGLVGILAHELYHVLQSEAANRDREAAFREGSANYVQLRVLRARGQGLRARLLERDRDPVYGEGERRFERLVAARGERAALDLALRAGGFPEGF